MNRVHLTIAPRALGLLLLLAVFATVPAMAGPPDLGLDASESDADAVRARLLSDHDAVEAGQRFWLGVHLSQDEGWHTYWRNGGDSGLPTRVEWSLPQGWEVGDLRWPAPHRYVEAGDLVTFGYSDEVVLLAPVTVPTGASEGEVTLSAEVDWLMCKELCIPGSAEPRLRLTVGPTVENTSAGDRRLIAAARERWPRPAEELGLSVTTLLDLSAVPAGQRAHAVLAIEELDDPATVELSWFPYAEDALFPERDEIHREQDRVLVHLPFELAPAAESGVTLEWGGVLEIHEGDRTRFVAVDLPVPVADEGVAIEARHGDLFSTLVGGEGLFDQDFAGEGGVAGPSRSLAYYLLLALIGGVILNVMPCVLPVLSLKVMSFVSHANEDRGVQVRLGLTFALGVLASFLALAAVVIGLQAAGDQLGWGFQFQNPAFVVVMAVIVFAFGMSLFGVYEIVLPVNFGPSGGRTGAYAESFLNGILATALATPCTAPFLGTALGFAFTQPAWAILTIFLTIGLGLSLPYVLLSLNPAWLRFVPKPGPWMDRFKQAMGFLLMATLVWLLWVLGQQIGAQGVIWTLAFLVVVAFALWMYGAFVDLSSSTRRRSLVTVLVVVLIAGGWWQFLREPLSAEAVAQAAAGAPGGEHGRWETFSVKTLEKEVAAGNTVFVDFTAAWCTTCKVNEKTVLATASVENKFEELGVVTLLGDWTHRDEEITQVLRKFGRSGVPFYAVFPAGRLDAPIVLPELITQGIVLEALEEAGPSQSVAAGR